MIEECFGDDAARREKNKLILTAIADKLKKAHSFALIAAECRSVFDFLNLFSCLQEIESNIKESRQDLIMDAMVLYFPNETENMLHETLSDKDKDRINRAIAAKNSIEQLTQMLASKSQTEQASNS